jgi:hypothetical protein
MSREARDRVWAHSRSHGSRKELLLWLAERADKDGVCWPGLTELQTVTGLKERSVQVILKQLEEDGEIYTPTSFGRGHTPLYVVTVGMDALAIGRVLANHAELQRRDLACDAAGADETAALIITRSHPQKAQNTAPFRRGEKAQNSAPFNGVKGAESLQEKAQNDCIKGAKSLQSPTPPNKEEPSKNRHYEPSSTLPRLRAGECEQPTARSSSRFSDEAIGAIYRAYPRLVGKRKALKAIRAALERIARGEDEPEARGSPPSQQSAAGAASPAWPPPDAAAWLEERTRRYAAARAGEEERYTPHPTTWFNGARYSDDEGTWRRSEVKPQASGNGNGNGSHSEYLEDLAARRADLERRKRELGLA